ncbi:potassium transporter Kup [Conexibacter sp. W3-3-2]|nr:potassium transporter Kup [Conexibacter sp. W3-3-2]
MGRMVPPAAATAIQAPALRAPAARTAARSALVLGALGVVFGDLGTSPLYTMQTVFNPDDPHPVAVSTQSVFGVVSMIFWSVVLIVSVTYVALVMRADNDGEGGIMALLTLLRRRAAGDGRTARRAATVLAGLGVFGAALFLGDSMITPAISVLSAVEGVKVAAPSLESLIVPVAAGIIVALFLAQRLGTHSVGRLFGPVMLVWFLAIGACGIGGIADHPDILRALSPTYALDFAGANPSSAFFALAAVVLAVTGAEALYADMGHFGRRPIVRAWFAVVFPACVLSYLGQGALILEDPGATSAPFFLLVPDWARWPMIVLATAATVIASQAVITGAFSVARQAAQLGYLPRLRILHTSSDTVGQVYVPWVNWTLMVAVLALVLTFRTSASLAFAFGMAVTGTITITTIMYFALARQLWRRSWWFVLPVGGALITLDLLFLAANTTKIPHGAWLPLLIATVTFVVLTTWQQGRRLVTAQRERAEGPLTDLVAELHAPGRALPRVPGSAVFLNRTKDRAPLALRATVEHLGVLPQVVVITSIETLPVPHVPPGARIALDDLGHADDGIWHLSVRLGYRDDADVPALLRRLDELETGLPVLGAPNAKVSFYLSTVDLRWGSAHPLGRLRTRLFLATARMTADAAEYFRLPRDRTVIVGSRVEL